MAKLSRRKLLIGGAAGIALAGGAGYWYLRAPEVPIGFTLTKEELDHAKALLDRHIAIDVHAHPGRTFVNGAEHLPILLKLYAMQGSFEQQAVNDMVAGNLTASSFAAVADFQTLNIEGEGLSSTREFEPGEAWASYKRQIANLRSLIAQNLVMRIQAPADFAAAKASRKIGAILSVEGGDFLEGKPERVAAAYADGVRILTLMHYRNNELGSIITDQTKEGGLTPAGEAIIREMNRLGMIIDIAHSSVQTAYGALETSTKPVIASHVHIHTGKSSHPRFIPAALAKAIAAKGGLVGAWPAGIGIDSLSGFVGRTIDLVGAVGIDHVCLGTDMDANYKPVFDNYRKLPLFVGGLAKRGLSEGDIAKIIGGNFLRVFRENSAAA
ncbi:MAG: membrane dipeptidase [Sphingorhabdus sp.]